MKPNTVYLCKFGAGGLDPLAREGQYIVREDFQHWKGALMSAVTKIKISYLSRHAGERNPLPPETDAFLTPHNGEERQKKEKIIQCDIMHKGESKDVEVQDVQLDNKSTIRPRREREKQRIYVIDLTNEDSSSDDEEL